jgi:two-component system, NarL family, response regulator NreC
MTAILQLAQAPGSSAYSPAADSDVKVVLADDQREVRRNLRLLLDGEPGIEVVAEAGDLSSAVRHVRGHAPHVLLLDLRLPGGSSIEAIRRLRADAPQTEIVVLTTEDSPVFAQQAIDAGAVGYALKDNADGDLGHAVRCAARGEEYQSPRVAARLAALRRAVDIDGLTARETEVLRLIALGFTSSEISEKLHLSRRTIDAHRRQIHRKLGLGKRSELVRYAMARNLIGANEEIAH